MMKSLFPKATAALLALVLVLTLLSGTVLADNSGSAPVFRKADLFTERDLLQEADIYDAETVTVSDGEDIRIDEEGVWVLSGSASEVTVWIDADKEDKVHLVLDGLAIANESFPCIYVVTADKVFITVKSDSSLSVSGAFIKDGGTKTDGVIYSKQDLVLNGTASLAVDSSAHGIVCKDDLKITGGTWNIDAVKKAISANDSIRIAGGTLNLTAGTDGIHAENKDDDSLGYIWIGDGTVNISAGDDGIHAVSVLQIDGGAFNISAAEGLEATMVQVNSGTIRVTAAENGVNATEKSSVWDSAAVFNGGETTVNAEQEDADGVDSKGDICINGGTLDVSGKNPFKCAGAASLNGGTLIVNGEAADAVPVSQAGSKN